MQHHHWQGLPCRDRGASVAMGNFDGVHLGHQSVIDLARRADAPLGVVTFEPHPRQVFAPDAPPFRLMNAEARANRLGAAGGGAAFTNCPLTGLAALTPTPSCARCWLMGWGAACCRRRRFLFRQGRKGGPPIWRELAREMGFGVTIAPLVAWRGEISSTAIRQALTDGRPRDAAAMLGHWHRIEGAVMHGEKRGRELGYPTANMSVAGLHLPRLASMRSRWMC
jgi:riboflavin kinase / FMN adenylyltransferase